MESGRTSDCVRAARRACFFQGVTTDTNTSKLVMVESESAGLFAWELFLTTISREWVSVRGAIMVGGQRIQVGLAHARKTVAVTVGPNTIQVAVETSITVTATRTTSRDIRWHKASNYG